ncbi:MAG: enoyl-CoA hydratase-related protein [Bacteroidia bacterium]|nr:enoyl-CoA hydratase-related protein [Bacteroidia bacterium]
MKKIIIQKENHIATITINEPEKLNALNTQILSELNSAFDMLATDADVRVIIITGAERSFVAGANIQEMAEMNYEEAKVFGAKGAAVFRKIETCPQPVIAAINGFALGGGSELALACDIRIASEKAKFGQPEVGLGITPGFSGTQRLARIVGQAKAKELIFTGKVITATDALQIGLVNQVVAPESLMDEVKTMAESIAKQAPIAVQKSKEAINNGWDLPIEEGIDLEVELFAQCFETEDQKNGMSAFLKKEKVEFKGK